MKLNMGKVLKGLTRWGTKHTPEILHALGFAAGASALALTASGTVKAVREIDEKQPATKKDTIKIAAKYYIPAAAAATASVAFHTTAARSYIKRNAMLASWGMTLYDRLNTMEEKNIEVLGEKKSNAVADAVAVEEFNKRNYPVNNAIETGHGNALFFDGLNGQIIRSDYHYILNTLSELNVGIANAIAAERGDPNARNGHYPSLWNYEQLMGEKETDHCNDYGWYHGQLIRVHISYEKAENGEPIGIISHQSRYTPRPEFMYTHGYS